MDENLKVMLALTIAVLVPNWVQACWTADLEIMAFLTAAVGGFCLSYVTGKIVNK